MHKALVIFCGVAIIGVCGQPVENNAHFLRKTVRQRTNPINPIDYPSLYSTIQVDYPGGVSGQNWQQNQLQPHVHVNPVPIVPPTQTIHYTTTTQEPIIVNDFEPAAAPLPVPTVRAPIQPVQFEPIHTHVGTRRPPTTRPQRIQQRVQVADDLTLTETEQERLLREQREREQAESAQYSFGTNIQDSINDHSISRQEERNGLALRGMYSYSDGFFKRTIHYEADENGYRVVNEQIEPIGTGPQFNPNGTAAVETDLHNNHVAYQITADDFVREKNKRRPLERETEI